MDRWRACEREYARKRSRHSLLAGRNRPLESTPHSVIGPSGRWPDDPTLIEQLSEVVLAAPRPWALFAHCDNQWIVQQQIYIQIVSRLMVRNHPASDDQIVLSFTQSRQFLPWGRYLVDVEDDPWILL